MIDHPLPLDNTQGDALTPDDTEQLAATYDTISHLAKPWTADRAARLRNQIDIEVFTALANHGLLAANDHPTPLATHLAVLLTERAAWHAVNAPIGMRTICAPLSNAAAALGLSSHTVGLVVGDHPTRYAGLCDVYLGITRDDDVLTVWAAHDEDTDVETVASDSGYPMGIVHCRFRRALPDVAAADLCRAARRALRAELAGLSVAGEIADDPLARERHDRLAVVADELAALTGLVDGAC